EEPRRHLEEHHGEPDRDREREDQRAARELGRDLLALLALLLGGVARRDRERPEPDRERLAERHHAANDRQPEEAMACHLRLDRTADLSDLAARRADGDGPVAGAAHHHALEDGLAAERAHPRLAVGAALGALGALETALEALHPAARVHELLLARVERVAVRADLDVQLGLRRSRLERVPAGARHGCEDVLGMDVGLHAARIAAACFRAILPPETTATTVSPASTGTLPERSAAT